MTIQLSDLLHQVIFKKLDKLQEERRKSMHRTSRASQAAKAAGKRLQGGETPETLGHRAKQEAEAQRAIETAKRERARGLETGTSEYEKAIQAAEDEFKKWDASRKLKQTTSDEPSTGSTEDEGHRRALAAAKRKAARKAAKAARSQVTEETDEEHAKKMQRDIKRYETGGTAAHKAALAAAKAAAKKRKKGAK